MRTFRIDVKVEGYETVEVKARTYSEAEQKAGDKVLLLVKDLRNKSFSYDFLSVDGREVKHE
jgi:hypothetical protein